MNNISKIFEGMLPELVEVANSLMKGGQDKSATKAFLDAFNNMQDEEFNCDNHIYNINDKDDLRCLIGDNLLDAYRIAVLYPKVHENGLFAIDSNGEFDVISPERLIVILSDNMETLMRCVLLYVPDNEKYRKIYNMVIADSLVESDFNLL